MDPKTLVKGTVLRGRFELIELLGEGGMAFVWAAKDCTLGRDVALKLYKPHARGLLSEARKTARVTHVNVVRLYDFKRAKWLGRRRGAKVPFLMMEWLKGCTLKAIIEGNLRLSFAERLQLAVQLARAVAAVHAEGLIHADIKTSNVHVSNPDAHGERLLCLLDFGIARADLSAEDWKAIGDDATTRLLAASDAYAAPEQLRRQAPDQRSDVFSLGVTLYMLLLEVHPFGGRSALDGLALLKRPSEIQWAVPAELDEILMTMLQEEPADRTMSAAEVERRLLALARAAGSQTDMDLTVLRAEPRPAVRAPKSEPASVGAAVLVRTAPTLDLSAPRASLVPMASGSRAILKPEAAELRRSQMTWPVARAEGTKPVFKRPIGVVLAVAAALVVGVGVGLGVVTLSPRAEPQVPAQPAASASPAPAERPQPRAEMSTPFNDIVMSEDGKQGFAVATDGIVVSQVGDGWRQRGRATVHELRRAVLPRRGLAYCVGTRGTLASSADLVNWTPEPTGTQATLTDVAVTEDGRRAWISGYDATLLVRDDQGVRQVVVTDRLKNPIAANFLSVAVHEGEVWLVTDSARVLHGNEAAGFREESLATHASGPLHRIAFIRGQPWVLGRSIVQRRIDGLWKNVEIGGGGDFKEIGTSRDRRRLWVSGTSMTEPVLHVSDDGGKTWREVPLRHGSGVIEIGDVDASGGVDGWLGGSGTLSTVRGQTLWTK